MIPQIWCQNTNFMPTPVLKSVAKSFIWNQPIKQTQLVTSILHIREDKISSNSFVFIGTSRSQQYCYWLLTLWMLHHRYARFFFDSWKLVISTSVKLLFIFYLCSRFLTRNIICLFICTYQWMCFRQTNLLI